MKAWLKRNFYRLYYYNKKINFGAGVLLNTKNHFEGLNAVGVNTEVATCAIGLGSYISDNSVIKHAQIGRFCSIGSNVQTGMGTHPTGTFVSTHPAFYSVEKHAGFTFATRNTFSEMIFIDAEKKYVVEIGNDVWVGSNVLIMDGIRIGDGAIIAAGSVVNKDVAPYAIVAGVPAKFIRNRFTDEQITHLNNIKWWNWPPEKIQAEVDRFQNIEEFIIAADAHGK
jgi:acetyltransferase-like isoleucine patch superfamily enzyme